MKKLNNNKSTLITFLIIFLCSKCDMIQAQDKNWQKLSLENKNIIFTPLENYKEIAKNVYFGRTNELHEHPGLLFKVLKNPNQSLAIGLVVLPILYSQTFKDSLRANNSYLATIANEQDESNFKTIMLSRRFARRVNADVVKMYQVRMEKLFLNKYDRCRALIYHKQNIADATVYFFYTAATSEAELEEEIKKNKQIIKFKN